MNQNTTFYRRGRILSSVNFPTPLHWLMWGFCFSIFLTFHRIELPWTSLLVAWMSPLSSDLIHWSVFTKRSGAAAFLHVRITHKLSKVGRGKSHFSILNVACCRKGHTIWGTFRVKCADHFLPLPVKVPPTLKESSRGTKKNKTD